MGRRKRETTMERPVPVKLRDEQLLAKAREMTSKLTTLKGLRRELSTNTRKAKEDIKALEGEVEQLRGEIADGFEMRPQGDLFAQDTVVGDDGKVPKGQAAQALGKIAEAAGEKKPTEPHAYEGVAAEVDRCKVCESTFMDPVHHGGDPLAETPQAAVPFSEAVAMAQQAHKLMECPGCKAGECRVHPHAFNQDGDSDRCTCGFVKRAKVHRVEAAEAAAPEPPAAEPATTESTTTSETSSNVITFATAPRAAEAQG
jgi:uncharacterized protein YjbJ (UPF0337 family)